MAGEDGGFVRADLAGDFLLERTEIVGRFCAGAFVAGQFRLNLARFEALGVWIDENLVDAIRRADGDARRNGNATAHDG